jgi:hypothetical protein
MNIYIYIYIYMCIFIHVYLFIYINIYTNALRTDAVISFELPPIAVGITLDLLLTTTPFPLGLLLDSK